MMLDAKLPMKFWVEAVRTAVYLHQRYERNLAGGPWWKQPQAVTNNVLGLCSGGWRKGPILIAARSVKE
jgi:hypothetical protein